MRCALLTAVALSLVPLASWAQTSWPFQPSPTLTDDKGSEQLNKDPVAVHTLPPTNIQLYNWGQGIPSQAANGVTDPLGFYVRNGGVFINKPFTWGTEDRACGLSVIVNAPPNKGTTDNDHCGAAGNIAANPSLTASYTGFDSIGLFVQNSAIAPMSIDPAGTFDARNYYPSAGSRLSSAQIMKLRVGMFIQAGPNNGKVGTWNGQVTGWASNGTSIQVSGWFTKGNRSSGQIPTNGLVTYVNAVTGIFTTNFSAEWNPRVNPLATDALGNETDIYNDSGRDSTISRPFGKGALFACSSTTGASNTCGFGVYTAGTWVAGMYVRNTTFGAFVYAPSSSAAGTALYSGQAAGNFLQMQNPTLGMVFKVTATGKTYSTGQMIYGNGTPDAAISTGYQYAAPSGYALSVSQNGSSFTSLIDASGNAQFKANLSVGGTTMSGRIATGNLTATVGAFTKKLQIPAGTEPSGRCSSPGALFLDPSGSALYACPSSTMIWKKVTLTTK